MTQLTSIEGDRLTAVQIADALEVHKTTIMRRADRESWAFESEPVLGGTRKLFPVATLPEDVQRRVILAYPPAPAADKPPRLQHFTYSPDSLWAVHDRKPEKQKAVGQRRTDILLAVMALADNGTALKTAFKLVGEREGESPRTLENWYHGKPGKPGAKHYERCDWLAALTPSYVGRTAKASCSPEAWDFFKADYLRLERPTAAACYERLKAAAAAHGWSVPSLKTLERRINKLPKALVVLMREGQLAANRLYPEQQRTVRDLHALQWINGDGYQHNVFVKWPDGSVARPKSWIWQDVHSRKILAWRTDLTEHTDVIRLSFGDLVDAYGLPDDITIDNTRAAANKWMTGGVAWRNRYKVGSEDVLGLWPRLGISVHWTSIDTLFGGKNIGHGQAKPVERAFGWGGLGDRVDKHPAFAGAWCGNNTQDKPENYASTAVPLDSFMTVLAEVLHAWNAREGRQTEMCGGALSFDQAFEQSYASAVIRKATAEQRRLWLLPAEARTVQRDGTITLDAGSAPGAPRNRYWSEELVAHIGHKVVVRFDPDKLHDEVHVYTLDVRYIGTADCHRPVGYGDTQAGREHSRARKQWKRAVRDQAAAEIKMDALQAASLLPGTDAPETPETKLVRPFRPPAQAVGCDVEITPEEYEQMQANFARNVVRLAQQNED